MNKKIIIIAAVIVVITIVVGVFLLVREKISTSGNAGTITGTLPPVSINETTSTTVNAAPTGNTIVIGTSQGSVTMKNFYKTADYITQDQQSVVIHQTSAYGIAYYVPDSSFTIAILSMPFEAARQAAETELLNALGVSQQDACKLRVSEGVPANVSDKYVGKVFPLSFCGNSTLPQ